MQPWLHARGVNLRYLGSLLSSVPNTPTLNQWRSVFTVELAARSFKRVLDAVLREGGGLGPTVAAVLNACLCGEEEGLNERDER